jgi:undecaprenyl-diphosphatase
VSPVLLVTHSDDWVWARLQRWRPPMWVERWMVTATRLGDGWVWIAAVLGTGSAGVGHGPARTLLETTAAAALVNATQLALKRAFRRSRPASRPAGRAGRTVSAPDRYSFPSGHTMNAFAVAVLVAVHAPVAGPWAFVAAGSIGASRVVLQLHFASDVAAGATLGSVLAALVVAAFGG